jgi:ferredoxin
MEALAAAGYVANEPVNRVPRDSAPGAMPARDLLVSRRPGPTDDVLARAPRPMSPLTQPIVRGARVALGRVDAGLNRLYGSRYNPFYHSGALVVALLLVLIVTGLYLLVFYRIGSPYASMERIQEQVWVGRWVRSLHRFASDAAVVAILVHALRMFVQSKAWGKRTLAWVTGVILTGVFLVCGWTGYVMVWDVQAQVLAVEGARLLDVLPIVAEPISRTFVGERPIGSPFFFMNLFLHVALPIGLGVLLWLHVARVARPVLMPARRVTWTVIGLLFLVSVVWPVSLGPEADLFRVPGTAPFDAFYLFWLPVTQAMPAWAVWAAGSAFVLGLILVPFWTRPAADRRPAPSVVNERLCTGCEQCVHDCPYQAITMVERTDGRAGLTARVDTALCVSCGICAGSCAPMGVGPPGRTGRDQMAEVRAFLDARRPGQRDVVIVGCTRGAGGAGATERFDGAAVFPVGCAGSMHTSVIEALLRGGAGGVLIVSCPASDCWNREGSAWLEARIYHEREAELNARVDRRRVRLVEAALAEPALVRAELAAFRGSLKDLAGDSLDDEIDVLGLCTRGIAQEEAR